MTTYPFRASRVRAGDKVALAHVDGQIRPLAALDGLPVQWCEAAESRAGLGGSWLLSFNGVTCEVEPDDYVVVQAPR